MIEDLGVPKAGAVCEMEIIATGRGNECRALADEYLYLGDEDGYDRWVKRAEAWWGLARAYRPELQFGYADPTLDEEFRMGRKFKVGDKVQTRDGRKARIICDDRVADTLGTTLVALVTIGYGVETIASYCSDGRFFRDYVDTPDDLIPVPETRTVWIAWWPNGNMTVDSAKAQSMSALACLKVEIEKGRFDE